MKDNVIKHLQMIQNIINRMALNSTLITAGAFLACMWLVLMPFVVSFVTLSFGIWFVISLGIADAFYLRQERLYRRLYDDVRAQHETTFSMDTGDVKDVPNVLETLMSKIIIIKYVPILAIVGIKILVIAMFGTRTLFM